MLLIYCGLQVMNTSKGQQDIVFDCPHCGKSLVIDRRGAGMQIRCPECNGTVTVPQPDYDEVSAEDLRLHELEDALQDCKRELSELTEELNYVSVRRAHLEKLRARSLKCFERIDRDLSAMEQAIQRIRVALLDAGFSPAGGDSDSPSDTESDTE